MRIKRQKWVSLLLMVTFLCGILGVGSSSSLQVAFAQGNDLNPAVTVTDKNIEISGSGLVPDSQVSLLVTDSDGTRQHINQVAVDSQGAYKFTFVLAKEGSYTATVNTGKELKTLNFSVGSTGQDTEAPVITTDLEDKTVTERELTFTASATDDVDGEVPVTVKVNGETVTEVDGKYTVELNDGANTIIIEAVDKAGNEAQKTIAVTYEKGTLSLRERVEAALPDTVNFAVENCYSWDWVAIGLARTGNADKIPADYIQNVTKNVKEMAAAEDQDIFQKQPTEYERSVLGVLAAGGNPRDLDGLDLIQRICNCKYIDKQGINAKIFGLIALDAGDYAEPENAQWTREKLVSDILAKECKDSNGGWNLFGGSADPDITGMAMIALAPYYNEKPEVKAAVDRAVDVLSSLQRDDGGYASWGTVNSESCAQVIMGLCANGFDPAGEKFTKPEGNVVDALLSFKVENSGFAHVKDRGANGMANEQALYALAQYLYFLDGKGCIFRWGAQPQDTVPPTITTDLENKVVTERELTFTASATDDVDGEVPVTVKVNGEAVTEVDGKYTVELNDGTNTIELEAEDSEGNKATESFTVTYSKKPQNFNIERLDDNSFSNGNDAVIRIKAKNLDESPQEAVLIVVLYDKDQDKMINYSFVGRTVESQEEVEMSAGFIVPEKGNLAVKAFVWDDLETMNVLSGKIIESDIL